MKNLLILPIGTASAIGMVLTMFNLFRLQFSLGLTLGTIALYAITMMLIHSKK